MSQNIDKQFTAPLAQEIQKEYHKLLEVVSRIPTTSLSKRVLEGTGGLVSIRDLIAYQIGWGRLLLSWYQSGIQGENPEMPGEGFKKWDYTGLAQLFYEKYQGKSFPKQIEEFHDVVVEILQFVEKEYKQGRLDQLGVWPWCQLASGKEWPLSKWVKVNTASPYKKASALIRKYAK